MIETFNELISYAQEQRSISEQKLDTTTNQLDHAFFRGEIKAYTLCLIKLEQLLP